MPGLFDPFTVRNHNLNRIVMAPMGTRLANPEGEVSDRHISHYTKRAAGYLGLVIVEVVFVTPGGKSDCHQLGISHDDHILGMRRLSSAIREAGSSPGIQLYHAGPRVEERGLDPVSPSGVPILKEWDINIRAMPEPSRVLREDEIEGIADSFAEAAARAVEAGFDLVEIHGAHGHLLSHFLSPLTNLRRDRYGGDINARVSFPCEVVSKVRKIIGDDFPLFYRLGA
ncbi:MAG: hypothetical protein Q7O66_13035, partial [Dehalococcoidia bacterium]|nr:hypothetical protein [Dehalococcoidia bacterium]